MAYLPPLDGTVRDLGAGGRHDRGGLDDGPPKHASANGA